MNKGLVIGGGVLVGLAALAFFAGDAKAETEPALPPSPQPKPPTSSKAPKGGGSPQSNNARNHPSWKEYVIARDNCRYWRKYVVPVVEDTGAGVSPEEAEQAKLEQQNFWCSAYTNWLNQIEADGYVFSDDDLMQL